MVHFELDKSALSFYDGCRHDWVAEPGEFQVLIGSSVSNIRLTGSFVIK